MVRSVHDDDEAAANTAGFADAVRFCDLCAREGFVDGEPETPIFDEVSDGEKRVEAVAVGESAAEVHAMFIRAVEVSEGNDVIGRPGEPDEFGQDAWLSPRLGAVILDEVTVATRDVTGSGGRDAKASLPLSALRGSVGVDSVESMATVPPQQPNFAAMRAAFVLRKAELGLTYDRLAELSGVGRRDVWRLSTGETVGTVASWYALAAAVEMPFPDLVAHLDDEALAEE